MAFYDTYHVFHNQVVKGLMDLYLNKFTNNLRTRRVLQTILEIIERNIFYVDY